MSFNDSILPAGVRSVLKTVSFGRRIYYLPEVTSVNDVASELARHGEPQGTLVMSDYQTRGRGRLDHSWESPPGKNLLLALILRPDAVSSSFLPITLALALGIAETLELFINKKVLVKWPNDVVVSGKKICGILAEGSSTAGRMDHIIIGIGINVNVREEDFSPDVGKNATSCLILRGETIERRFLLAELLLRLENVYDKFLNSGFAAFLDSYNQRLSLAGRVVSFTMDAKRRTGRAVGVLEDGSLKVQMDGGEFLRLYNEEVTLKSEKE